MAQNYYKRWDITIEEDIVASERQQRGLARPSHGRDASPTANRSSTRSTTGSSTGARRVNMQPTAGYAFETRANKHPVFRMTEPPIVASRTRSGRLGIDDHPGDDPRKQDLASRAPTGLVTSNDVLREPDFPLADLATSSPRLRWIHIIGAGIEPLLPLDWLPDGAVLTNNSGVHVEKSAQIGNDGAVDAARPPARHRDHPAKTPSLAANLHPPHRRSSRLLIVGVGDMGGAVAAAAGSRTASHRRAPQRRAHPEVEHMATPEALDGLLRRPISLRLRRR